MADSKTTALTAATSWASGDLLYLVRDPAGTPVSRKITVDNILQNLVCAANTSLLKSTTGYSLTGSNASSMIDLAGTLNTTGSPAIIKIAMSNTASGATTKFLSCLAGASGTTEVLSVDKAGAINVAAPSGDVTLLKLNGTTVLRGSNGNSAMLFGLPVQIDGPLQFSSGANPSTLIHDAANTLALRNSTNAQAFNVYKTYTDASNYERLTFGVLGTLDGFSNRTGFKASKAGTGGDINIDFFNETNGSVSFGTNNQHRWFFNPNGHLVAWDDNSYDIGESGAARPRSIYVGTSLFLPASSSALRVGTHSAIAAETITGYITIKDSAGNDRKIAVVS